MKIATRQSSLLQRRPAPRAGQRARASVQVLVAALLAVATGYMQPFVGRALAMMSAQTSLANNTFSTRSLAAPSALTGSAQGPDIDLSWSAGSGGDGYAINGVAAASSDCGGAVFDLLGVVTATTFVDAGRAAPPGTWFCYQAQTAASTWRSLADNPVLAVQVGFVARAVALINGGDASGCGAEQQGVAGDLDCGDQVVVAFNQAVDPASAPAAADTVCASDASGTLWLGSAITTGACVTTETVSLGRLAGGALGQCDCRFAAAYAWSADHMTLTVTLGARLAGTGYPSLSGGPWTFTPTAEATRLLSSAGAIHICDNNDGGGQCLPVAP